MRAYNYCNGIRPYNCPAENASGFASPPLRWSDHEESLGCTYMGSYSALEPPLRQRCKGIVGKQIENSHIVGNSEFRSI